MTSYLFATVLICVVILSNSDAKKRILLSDPSYVTQLEAKLQELTVKVDLLTSQLAAVSTTVSSQKTGSGGVYTRWGRTTCPHNDTDLVYSGWTGGSAYNDASGSPDWYCMPKDPEWDPSAGTTAHVYMHGGEYDSTFFGATTIQDDAPCAVCQARSRTSVIMIPGKTSCYSGWTKEYYGFLAGNYGTGGAASDFVCLDRHPEATPHGGGNDNGKIFYPVSGVCSNLPCPPYVNHKALSCVICSK